MRKILLLLVGVAVLWVPAVSVAGDSSQGPSKLLAKGAKPDANREVNSPAGTCQSQRSESNFAASHNGQTFTQLYGTHGKGRGVGANAFGKCVSTTAKHKDKGNGKDGPEGEGKDSAKSQDQDSAERAGKESVSSHGKASTSPAMACKAMAANDPTHFQTRYGTAPNAFGNCVSEKAKTNSKDS